MKDWRILRLGHHWSILWIFSLCPALLAVPDPAALHEVSEAEYDSWLRSLHPPQPLTYDTQVARIKRQAGIQTYDFNSDEAESGPWEEWGLPGACSR